MFKSSMEMPKQNVDTNEDIFQTVVHKRAMGKISSTNSGFKARLNVGSKLQYRPKAPSRAPKGSNETGPKDS